MDPDAGRGSPSGAIAAERNYSDTSAYRPEAALDAESLYLREHNAFGGVRLGSAFFGWLVAAGLMVLITSVVVGVAAAFGMADEAEVRGWLDNVTKSGGAAAITAGAALGVIVLLAYFGGGYVAGRMARFDGVRQGLAVWLWGIVMSLLAGVIGLAVGGLGVLTGPGPVPLLGRPLHELTFPGLIALAVVLLAVWPGHCWVAPPACAITAPGRQVQLRTRRGPRVVPLDGRRRGKKKHPGRGPGCAVRMERATGIEPAYQLGS